MKIKSNTSSKLSGIILAIIVMALWGSLFPFVKIGYKAFELDTSFIPNLILFAGLRFLVCGAGISGYTVTKKRTEGFGKNQIIAVIAISAFSIILHYICTYVGLSMADSSATALLKQLGAFIFIPFSFLFFKDDKFSIQKLIALFCGIGGIATLNITSAGFSFGLGEILVIGASFCGVIASIISKRTLKSIDPVALTGFSQLFGGVFLLILGLSLGGGIGAFNLKSALVFIYICAASTIAYCLWNMLLKRGDLSELLILKFAEPVFAAVFGAILLSEDIFNLRFLAALLLTSFGIIITNYKPKGKL